MGALDRLSRHWPGSGSSLDEFGSWVSGSCPGFNTSGLCKAFFEGSYFGCSFCWDMAGEDGIIRDACNAVVSHVRRKAFVALQSDMCKLVSLQACSFGAW